MSKTIILKKGDFEKFLESLGKPKKKQLEIDLKVNTKNGQRKIPKLLGLTKLA